MTPPVDSVPTIGSPARAWIATIAAALAAAAITWAIGESLLIEETGHGAKGGGTPISPVVSITRNGMMCLGLLGGSLGLALGVAGGLLRGSARSAGLAGLVGVALGAAAGAGAARALIPVYFRFYSGIDLGLPLLIHGVIWTAIALAAGLAFGLGLGGARRIPGAATSAIVGALLATFSYEFASIPLFPATQTDRPLPMSPASRMFAYLVVALFVAAALASGASRKAPPPIEPAPVVS